TTVAFFPSLLAFNGDLSTVEACHRLLDGFDEYASGWNGIEYRLWDLEYQVVRQTSFSEFGFMVNVFTDAYMEWWFLNN
ncbi:hypothetical protein, partial [Klebsiella michiganensis]